MKKTLLTALILTFSSGLALAQQQGGPNADPRVNGMNGLSGNPGYSYALNRAERLTERLGLSDAQAAELALIYEDAQMQREEERARARLVADEIRAAIHLTEWAAVAEVVGTVGVIVSLVFLIISINQEYRRGCR